MRLAEFILRNLAAIVQTWETFAATQLLAAAYMDSFALRDHAEEILRAIAKDVETYQSRAAQIEKSLGNNPLSSAPPRRPLKRVFILRVDSGFDINQLAAEYRALRASVLRLWIDAHQNVDAQLDQVMRFNEAIDQALTESIQFFQVRVEQARLLAISQERDAQRPAFANVRGGSSRATVVNFSRDGKSYLELRDADADNSERGELFLRHLSPSIVLQRSFSTESLTVSGFVQHVERQTEQAVQWLADD